MIKDQCISITDIRRKGSQCLENIELYEKYIFINNKPKAVLMDIDFFEEHFPKVQLVRMRPEEITLEMKRKKGKVMKKKKSELLNI